MVTATARTALGSTTATLWTAVAKTAAETGLFGPCVISANGVDCPATGSAQPATYRVSQEGEALYVSLLMADRWQSHSIEADLLNTGDKIEELVAEELAELDYVERRPGDAIAACEHFRSEDKLFTFRSRVPVAASDPHAAAGVSLWLRAYEAAFRRLGDMDAGGGED